MRKAAHKRSGASDEFRRCQLAAKYVLSRTKLRPSIAVVLGSGLGAFADELTDAVRIPYARVPGFSQPTAEGHAGRLVIGKAKGVPLAVMQGRIHFYEGYSPKQVVYPLRVLRQLGIQTAILTNAAGAINLRLRPGTLVAIQDHINLQGFNVLAGPNDVRFGLRFPDMSEAYCKQYRALAIAEGNRLGIDIGEGVYAAVSGPSFETPAEIRFLRTIGADMVGMSTVQEVIAARHMGLRVLGISCITNMAAGILPQPLSHEEVMETGERVAGQFAALVNAVIPRMEENLERQRSARSAQ